MLAASAAAAAAAYFPPQASSSLLLPDVLPAAPVATPVDAQAAQVPSAPWPMCASPSSAPLSWSAPAWYPSGSAYPTAPGVPGASQTEASFPLAEGAPAEEAAPAILATPPRKSPLEEATAEGATPPKVRLDMAAHLETPPPMVLKLSEVVTAGSPVTTCTPGSASSSKEGDTETPAGALRFCMREARAPESAGQMLLQLLKQGGERSEQAETETSGRRRRRGGRGRGHGGATGVGNATPSTSASDGECEAAASRKEELAASSRELMRQLKAGPHRESEQGVSSGRAQGIQAANAEARVSTRRAKNGERRELRAPPSA